MELLSDMGVKSHPGDFESGDLDSGELGPECC